MTLDMSIDVFDENGKAIFIGDYNVFSDHVVFHNDDYNGKTVEVQGFLDPAVDSVSIKRETVTVGMDRRAPIPWRSVEAKLDQAHPVVK